MGVYLTYYIEFKSRNESKWKLLSFLMPQDKRQYHHDSDDVVSAGDLGLFDMVSWDCKQGVIRDILSDHDTEFADRGFPKDVSEELDVILKKDIEGDERDWRWGKSYVTLVEAENAYKKMYNVAFERYMKHRVDDRFDYLNKRFDRIECFLKGEETGKLEPFNKEEDFFFEDESWEKEELDAAIWFGKWLYFINQMVDFATGGWYDSDEIRIVYHLS